MFSEMPCLLNPEFLTLHLEKFKKVDCFCKLPVPAQEFGAISDGCYIQDGRTGFKRFYEACGNDEWVFLSKYLTLRDSEPTHILDLPGAFIVPNSVSFSLIYPAVQYVDELSSGNPGLWERHPAAIRAARTSHSIHSHFPDGH